MLTDSLQRPLRDLRLSITDRCNYRCAYCMPREHYDWIPRHQILTYEEIERVVRLLVELGVDKVRITGGEPLLRSGVDTLVRDLARIPGIRDLCLTTNGALLAEQAEVLARGGLRRVNVSLDTMNADRFRQLTGRDELARVLEGLSTARRCGLAPVKLNAVIIRGFNDDEILALADYARGNGYSLRFVEFMDVGNANRWTAEQVVPMSEIIDTVRSRHDIVPDEGPPGSAPATSCRYTDGGGQVGFIASVTQPFCGACNRLRLTAEGRLVTCLFARDGIDLRELLRGGSDDRVIRETIQETWRHRADRHSEQRLQEMKTAGGYTPGGQRKIEMIQLGG
jgi:GTP 3',8-cyclase